MKNIENLNIDASAKENVMTWLNGQYDEVEACWYVDSHFGEVGLFALQQRACGVEQ